MKVYLFSLLFLTTVAYGGTGFPLGTGNKGVRLDENDAGALGKAGETLLTLGRLLQGENVALSKEAKSDFFKVIQVLAHNGEDLSDGASEYFLPILVRAITRGVVAHTVQKNLNRG